MGERSKRLTGSLVLYWFGVVKKAEHKVKLVIYMLMYVLPLMWSRAVGSDCRIRLWIQAAECFVKDEGSALEIERYYFCCYTLSLEILSSFS